MKIIITDDNIKLIDASAEDATAAISVLVNTIRGIMHSKGNPVREKVLKTIFNVAVNAGFEDFEESKS